MKGGASTCRRKAGAEHEDILHGHAVAGCAFIGGRHHRGGWRRRDDHALGGQRVSNLACWSAGYARTAGTVFEVPESAVNADRRPKCVREYLELRTAWQRLLRGHLAPNIVE